MTCFFSFDDCKISYFEINFNIKRQVKTNKAKASLAALSGWQIFSHWDSALLNDIMKPSENTHKVKQTQIVPSSGVRRWQLTAPVHCQVCAVMIMWHKMCDASRVVTPGWQCLGKISKLQYCVCVIRGRGPESQSRNIEVRDNPRGRAHTFNVRSLMSHVAPH